MKRYIRSAVTLPSDEPKRVRESFILDPNASARLLAQLADDPDFQVRSMVAYHENTPADVLDRLAGDEYASVLEALVRNPNISEKTLKKLAARTDFWGLTASRIAQARLNEIHGEVGL